MKTIYLIAIGILLATMCFSQTSVGIIEIRENNSQGIPIHQNSIKTISGVVTASKEFGATGPAFMQDKDAGVALFGSSLISQLSNGDSITVTSKIIQFNGLTEVSYIEGESDVTIHKNTITPEPKVVTISELLNQDWNGIELLEGRLVKIEKVTFVESGTFTGNTNYQITDATNSITLRVDVDTDITGSAIPNDEISIIGCLGQFDSSEPYSSGYQIIPRSIHDIKSTPPQTLTEELSSALNKKVSALNLHIQRHIQAPFTFDIEILSPSDFEAQKPASALSFDAGYVNANGKVFVSTPTTTAQKEVFTDINQAAIYYVCQSFLQYYYQVTEMPLWFKVGFAAYEADMRINDADIKTAYTNYNGTLTSFTALNNPTTFVANNGFAISYLFGEFIGVFKSWSYNMVQDVNASTIIPNSTWYNAGTIEDLFDYFILRYFKARILETNEKERLKFGKETEHFKHYYREAEDYWLAHFPDILEDAIAEYQELLDFETFEKFSSLTMPICNYATIGGGECVNLRYKSGTAWSSGIWASSPDTDNADDIKSFNHLIRHELAHLVQAQLKAGNMTAWLNEGFAEFMSRGPSTQDEKEALKSETKKTLNDAINYFGHLPTFEDTKVYPGQTTVDYYLLGQIMQNFIYETGGYSAVREVIIHPENGITNMGFSSMDAFMAAYYHYLNLEYLQIPDSDSFTNYDAFITKLTNLTSSADSSALLNSFWDELLATKNFPFAIDNKVAFLYRGDATSISWAGMFNEWSMNADKGTRLGASDIWILEKEFLKDTRSEYKIVKNGGIWISDPNNPHPLSGEFGNSELWMPDYASHTELILRPEIAKGSVTNNIRITSSNLGYTSQYRVYTPAGYDEMENLPTIYLTDGQNYLDDTMGKMRIVLDNLIADGIIKPIVAVFLDPRDPDNLSNDRRGNEYRNNPAFVEYVCKELIPEIQANFKTNNSAADRAIMGSSYGGYNAAFFSINASEYFNYFGINSAYLHPQGDYSIDQELENANLDELKFYLSYGTFDGDGERYFNRLKDILDHKGVEVMQTIIGDGHTWQNWSRLVADALKFFFAEIPITPLTIISPNGGEKYTKGESVLITWAGGSSTSFNLKYSTDNGSTWHDIASEISAELQQIEWLIPNEISNKYLIKVIDASNPDIFDLSDTNFEIFQANNAGGPYAVDDNTILLLHFEDNLINKSILSDNGISHGSGISFSSSVNPSLGKCIKIDNSNVSNEAYISIPHNENLNLSESWTIEAWFYLTSVGLNTAVNPTILSKASYDGPSNYFVWYHNSWGTWKGQFSDTKSRDIYVGIGNNTVTTGKWYHLTYTRDATLKSNQLTIRNSNWELLSQEESQFDETQSTPMLNDEDLLIGKLFSPFSFYFDGYIDELRISNVVREFSVPQENVAPVISNIPNQSINNGDSFMTIQLDDFVNDLDNEDSEITWSFSGTKNLSISINGSREASITIQNTEWNGSETITFTATDPKGDYSSYNVVFSRTTVSGVADKSYESTLFSFYPNPAKEFVYINSPEIGKLSFYSLTGQKVLEKNNFLSDEVKVSELQKGIYLVVLLSEKNIFSKKLIIE